MKKKMTAYSRYVSLLLFVLGFLNLQSQPVSNIKPTSKTITGKVVDEKELAKDKDTISLHAFNEMVKNDARVEKVLIPIRDGLYLIRKIA